MFEKWSIHAVAEEIERQFVGAKPTTKLARRFEKEGKRQGKHRETTEPMRTFLINAVELATSKLVERYRDDESALDRSLAGLQARKTLLAETKHIEPGQEAVSTAAGAGSESVAADANGRPDLTQALQNLKARRKAAEEAAEAARKKAESEAQEQERQGLHSSIEVSSQALENLLEKYRQLVESCQKTGELFWAAYCKGYLHTLYKHGVPDKDELPEVEIEFEFPEVLEEDDQLPESIPPVSPPDAVKES